MNPAVSFLYQSIDVYLVHAFIVEIAHLFRDLSGWFLDFWRYLNCHHPRHFLGTLEPSLHGSFLTRIFLHKLLIDCRGSRSRSFIYLVTNQRALDRYLLRHLTTNDRIGGCNWETSRLRHIVKLKLDVEQLKLELRLDLTPWLEINVMLNASEAW